MPLTERARNIVGAVADFFQLSRTDAVRFQIVRRARRGFDIEAEIVKSSHQRQRFLFIFIAYGNEHRAVILQFHSGSLQRFVQGAVKLIVVADRFARRLHFRRKVGVEPADFAEREYGNFYVISLLFFGINRENPLFFQRLAEDDFRGDIRKRKARGFGKKRYGTRGARVDFDNVHALVFIYDELNVVQADDTDGKPQFAGVL